jgi:threonine dehydrogenase-like Zn-dependent dehydrogenase
LVKIPNNGIRDLDYLLLADILPTAWTALDFSKFQAGDSVAVFGAGPVGLLCAHLALVRGASKVYSIDHVQDRLDKAASIGAIPINFTDRHKGSASEQILALEPGGVMRSCDCCGYECVNPKLKFQPNYIIQEAAKITSTWGGIGIIGVYTSIPPSAGAPNAGKISGDIVMPLGTIFGKRLSIGTGAMEPYHLIPLLMNMIEEGRINTRFIYTNEVSIEDAPLVYRRFSEKKEIKVAFRFPWEWEPKLHNKADGIQNGLLVGDVNGGWNDEIALRQTDGSLTQPRK